MQNFLGTCLVLLLLGGGFAVTGDLGRLAARGLRVIEATGVPHDRAVVPEDRAPLPPHSASGAVAAAPLPALPDVPVAPRAGAASMSPRGDVVDAVDITTLAPGSRIVVWIRPPDRAPVGALRHLTCDIVDPAGREALVSEIEPPAAPGLPALAPAPPRRAIVGGTGPGGTIARGGTLEIRPRGIAGGGAPETVGPVFALDVQR